MSTMRLALLVGVLAAMLGAGVAYAAIPDGSGVFQACYKTNGGQVRLVDSAADCNASETATQWSQTGPQGAQGPPGAQGPQGEPGPQGPPGTFSGVFQSPNHQFRLEVSDNGIFLRGPTAKIELDAGGIRIDSQGLNGLSLRTGPSRIDMNPGLIDVNAGGLVTVNGAQIQLNGCKPVARVGDLATGVGISTIITGSPTVCAGP
jgi:hypothetical protein